MLLLNTSFLPSILSAGGSGGTLLIARLHNTKSLSMIGELIETDNGIWSFDVNGNLRAGQFVEEDNVFYFKSVPNGAGEAMSWNDIMTIGTWGDIYTENWNFTFNEHLRIVSHEFIETDSIT